jgi:hypothetical protein
MVWRFDRAPVDLQRQHSGRGAEWLLLIPPSMVVIDNAIMPDLHDAQLCRYETESGVVYVGSGPLDSLMDIVSRFASGDGVSDSL